MTTTLVIVGSGGFGREVWSIVAALPTADQPWAVEGFVDDDPTTDSLRLVKGLGSTFIGSIDHLATRRSPFDAALAIGSPAARKQVYMRMTGAPVRYPRIVHPDTTIGQGVELGDGVIIAPGARLSTNITVGLQVQIDQNATVGHDSKIGAFTRLSPQACISGAVSIGDCVLVGASATILQGLTIGEGATIGAGACVVNNIAPGATVKGVPAR